MQQAYHEENQLSFSFNPEEKVEEKKKVSPRKPSTGVRTALSRAYLTNGTGLRKLSQELRIPKSTLHRMICRNIDEIVSNDDFPQKNEGGTPWDSDETSVPKTKWFCPKVGILVLLFLCFEYFLVREGILLQREIFGMTLNDSILKTLLAEIIPMIFAFFLQRQTSFIRKSFLSMALIFCFLYSVFSVAGRGVGLFTDGEHQVKILKKQETQLLTQSQKLEKEIQYYMNRKQSDGTIGWPITVRKLRNQASRASVSLSNVQEKISNLGDRGNKKLNLIFDVALRVLVQMASVLLFSQVSGLFLDQKDDFLPLNL